MATLVPIAYIARHWSERRQKSSGFLRTVVSTRVQREYGILAQRVRALDQRVETLEAQQQRLR